RLRREQGVTPIEGGPQRLLMRRQVRRAAREGVHAALQAREQRLRRQVWEARGGELDGKRKAIQLATDRDEGRRIGVGQGERWVARLRTLEEERHRWRLRDLAHWRVRRARRERQRGQGEDVFTAQAQRRAAGHQRRQVWALLQQIRKVLRARRHVLEVIQQQQGALAL